MKKHWKQNLKKLVISCILCLLFAASGSACGKNARLVAHDAFAGTEDQTEALQENVTEAEDQSASGTEENAASDADNAAQADDRGSASENEPESEKMEVPGASSIFVYICGQVLSPGVYELKEGSRICDAVEAAGGMTKDAAEDYWNLAQLLTDGEMVYIPTIEEAEERGGSAAQESQSTGSGTGAAGYSADSGSGNTVSGSTSVTQGSQGTGDGTASQESTSGGTASDSGISSDGRVNINTAGKETLMTISGIGEARAEAIIAYREEHGSFSDVCDIKNVSGIGDALYDRIKDAIMVE